MKTALLLLSCASALAQPCPPDAISAAPWASLFPNRNGQAITGKLYKEDQITIAAALVYQGVDGEGNTAHAFHGGRLLLIIGSTTNDITPVAGVPILGPPECNGIGSIAIDYPHTVERSAAIELRYDGFTLDGRPASARSFSAIDVHLGGPLHITTTNLWFYAEPGQYQIESTGDFATWTPIGAPLEPVDGRCERAIATVGVCRFYRYRYQE